MLFHRFSMPIYTRKENNIKRGNIAIPSQFSFRQSKQLVKIQKWSTVSYLTESVLILLKLQK